MSKVIIDKWVNYLVDYHSTNKSLPMNDRVKELNVKAMNWSGCNIILDDANTSDGGDTLPELHSYGSHYKIAMVINADTPKPTIIINGIGYSSSTSQHINKVRRAAIEVAERSYYNVHQLIKRDELSSSSIDIVDIENRSKLEQYNPEQIENIYKYMNGKGVYNNMYAKSINISYGARYDAQLECDEYIKVLKQTLDGNTYCYTDRTFYFKRNLVSLLCGLDTDNPALLLFNNVQSDWHEYVLMLLKSKVLEDTYLNDKLKVYIVSDRPDYKDGKLRLEYDYGKSIRVDTNKRIILLAAMLRTNRYEDHGTYDKIDLLSDKLSYEQVGVSGIVKNKTILNDKNIKTKYYENCIFTGANPLALANNCIYDNCKFIHTSITVNGNLGGLIHHSCHFVNTAVSVLNADEIGAEEIIINKCIIADDTKIISSSLAPFHITDTRIKGIKLDADITTQRNILAIQLPTIIAGESFATLYFNVVTWDVSYGSWFGTLKDFDREVSRTTDAIERQRLSAIFKMLNLIYNT